MFKTIRKPINSIYVIAGMIIVLSVLAIMSVSTFLSYHGEKQRIDQEIKANVQDTLLTIEEHIEDLISSYSVNEYSKFIGSEVKYRHLFAMIVEDKNMGAILGKKVYVKGKIRDENWQVVDYDPEDSLQREQLQNAYFTSEKELVNNLGQSIGKIIVVVSDHEFHQRLDNLIYRNLLATFAISALLVATLFLMMRLHLLEPLTNIIEAITQRDSEGLPLEYAPIKGPNEIRVLSQTINHMIKATRVSRQQLMDKSDALRAAKERFQLAIDGTRDGLWDWNAKEGKIYVSEQYEAMLGYQSKDMPDTLEEWLKMIHPDDVDKAQYEIKRYLESKGQGVYENTFRMRTKSGQWLWITSRGKAIFDDEGNPVRFVGFNTDMSKLIQQQEELKKQKDLHQYLANHDTLTNLANRSLFNDRLMHSIKQAQRNGEKLAVLFIDLDYFKEINDSLGHNIGDKVIQSIAKRLQHLIRGGDTIARLGGDEFTILMDDLPDEQSASHIADRVIENFRQPVRVDHHELHLSCSIGISIYPDNGETPTDMLKNADAAMYRAKNLGRNNFQYYSKEMTEEAFERLNMEANIRSGIQNEEFIVYYQPQINSSTQQIIGMEALVRWNSPSLGFITPGRFIPLAIATGSIIDLDRYVMKKAFKEFAAWIDEGLDPGHLSINLNMKQLIREDFVSYLSGLIEQGGFSASCIELEVTEGELMDNPSQAINVLKQVESLGVKLSLDDFGTGYSSLSYLKKLPISKLKIDKSFVDGLPFDKEDEAIVRAIIALAQSLNLDIIAEGAENLQQVDFLSQLGCSNFQGYFFSKPIPAEEMHNFLIEYRRSH
ncbi:GGDEF domain-containing phosphodiesterase [Thiomicrorhabdus heinhorstiae]|uniref:EAL domain-containing protein n=1 Tax=Thiomicrorhabdus heinhorstiae TaxID=2748010 RepID=A0ABS0BSH8_9GAMM|nr:GGDEF domain-containing phosphodiesterase [Thiomicrorhabdus heinhorstiae]MBF6056808.1 EAL domain-containing protein [Thiomicrorhabdus heinhorstiae]